jgi:hypothetical protein
MLSGTVGIGIEYDEHLSVPSSGKLCKLYLRQVSSKGTGRVDKACLPKNGQIEEAFDQDDLRESCDRAPRE